MLYHGSHSKCEYIWYLLNQTRSSHTINIVLLWKERLRINRKAAWICCRLTSFFCELVSPLTFLNCESRARKCSAFVTESYFKKLKLQKVDVNLWSGLVIFYGMNIGYSPLSSFIHQFLLILSWFNITKTIEDKALTRIIFTTFASNWST